VAAKPDQPQCESTQRERQRRSEEKGQKPKKKKEKKKRTHIPFPSHHHKPRPPLLHIPCAIIPGPQPRHTPHSRLRVPFTIRSIPDLKVIILQHNTTRHAWEASWVKLEMLVGFEVLALDAADAGAAEGAVEPVVVLLAVGEVVEDVEVGRGEGRLAGAAGEALFVVAACEAAWGVFDGFAVDGFGAAAAFAFAGGLSGLGGW
jgi:hypothetical protein